MFKKGVIYTMLLHVKLQDYGFLFKNKAFVV